MNFENIILTENTDGLYDDWTEYRNQVTDYIINSIEHDLTMKKLFREDKLRLKEMHKLEMLIDSDNKPVLAIWGAGGCNDIDILKLANYFRLVLIDNDVDRIVMTRKRFGLNEKECVCTDMHFWDIKGDEYLMFEALLKDNASIDEISKYFDELVGVSCMPHYEELPKFDYSVVAGVASQLNVRFAVLAEMYGRYEEIYPFICGLNEHAVANMMSAVCKMTMHEIIIGYELRELSSYKAYQIDSMCQLINDENEYICPLGNEISVAGSYEMEQWIDKNLEDKKIRVLCHRALVWNFIQKKKYLMMFLTFIKNIKNIRT